MARCTRETANSLVRGYWRRGTTGVPFPELGDQLDFYSSPDLSMTQPTVFSASHVYDLRLMATSSAGTDSQSASVEVSGLEAVPDTGSALLLIGIGSWHPPRERRISRPRVGHSA